MAATALDLLIEQGATLSQSVALGASFAGQTVRATIRSGFPAQVGGAGDKVVDLSCTVVDGSGNTVLSLTATQTAALTVPANARFDERVVLLGRWDLESVGGAVVTRHRQGDVRLSREVTT